jgi:hypothetical protein
LKKLDLGQSITILANLGVIAGIVFLGFELQQNNQLLTAQARSTRLAVRLDEHLLPVRNENLANVLIKHRHGEELTEYEEVVLSRYMETNIVIYQNVFTEYRRGLIDENTIPVEAWSTQFSGRSLSIPGHWPNLSDYWEERKFGYDPDFVAWMEANVINR